MSVGGALWKWTTIVRIFILSSSKIQLGKQLRGRSEHQILRPLPSLYILILFRGNGTGRFFLHSSNDHRIRRVVPHDWERRGGNLRRLLHDLHMYHVLRYVFSDSVRNDVYVMDWILNCSDWCAEGHFVSRKLARRTQWNVWGEGEVRAGLVAARFAGVGGRGGGLGVSNRTESGGGWVGNESVEDRKWLVVRLLICLLKRMSGIDIEMRCFNSQGIMNRWEWCYQMESLWVCPLYEGS